MMRRLAPIVSQRCRSFATESIFSHIVRADPDPILGTFAKFVNDKSPSKVFLAVGAYRTEEGKPYIFNCVKKAEKMLMENPQRNHEYLPEEGHFEFRQHMKNLLFGAKSPILNRVGTLHTLSGTGALGIAAHFIARYMGNTRDYYLPPYVYVSTPTYVNHPAIVESVHMEPRTYRYFNPKTKRLDLNGMLADLQAAPDRSIVILQSCGHNPAATDPTLAEWAEIARVMQRKKHIPWFDAAYQGFVSGDLDKDAAAVRLFAELGMEMFVCQSLSKNMGMYGQRCGALHFVSNTQNPNDIVTRANRVTRTIYSMPPRYGADVASIVMGTPALTAEWKSEIKAIVDRFQRNREALYDHMIRLGTPGDWTILRSQCGMFSYLGLSPAQCAAITAKHHIYLVAGGRICWSGITEQNVEYVAKALDDVIRTVA